MNYAISLCKKAVLCSVLLLFVVACLAGYLSGCASKNTGKGTIEKKGPGANSALFKDVAPEGGIKFTHQLGDAGKFYFVEFTAPGCAFFDYDNDSFLDVFLVQSGSSAPPASVKNRPHCALFHNQGDGTFVDVTRDSGFDRDLGYAQGVAIGDFDNDGFKDLFLTAYGGNHLFRNRAGKGQFEDVTKTMGLDKIHDTGYATSAAWGDYDSDGRLDLFVCYYAHWSHALDKQCRDKTSGELDYCHPQLYDPITHCLYRNEGKRFSDLSEKSGIAKATGRGLAAAFVDYNEDGRPDIFVGNDVTPNILWRNNGNGTFTNAAAQAGIAYDGEGKGIASMGLAIADYDHSGHQSVYISNFSSRPNILFQNLGGGLFEDSTGAARLSFSHLKFLSFGCEFLDYDADGWSDLIVNNGHVQVRKAKREPGVELLQRKQLLRNKGNGSFEEITTPTVLGDLATPTRGRGLATGDFDNDGRIDILCVNQNAPAQLFRNLHFNGRHWISFATVGTKSNRDGIGTRIEIKAGNMRQISFVRGGSSYLSSSDHRVYFGLGNVSQVDKVIVKWPSGTRDVFEKVPADKFYVLKENGGLALVENKKQQKTPS